jgi:hypothetical protein
VVLLMGYFVWSCTKRQNTEYVVSIMIDGIKYKYEIKVMPQMKKCHNEERQAAYKHSKKHEGNILNNITNKVREYCSIFAES